MLNHLSDVAYNEDLSRVSPVSFVIYRLLLPALDFGTVYMSRFITHNILSKAENSFISAILPRHYFITALP